MQTIFNKQYLYAMGGSHAIVFFGVLLGFLHGFMENPEWDFRRVWMTAAALVVPQLVITLVYYAVNYTRKRNAMSAGI